MWGLVGLLATGSRCGGVAGPLGPIWPPLRRGHSHQPRVAAV